MARAPDISGWAPASSASTKARDARRKPVLRSESRFEKPTVVPSERCQSRGERSSISPASIARQSGTLLAMGFWQETCLPARTAEMT